MSETTPRIFNPAESWARSNEFLADGKLLRAYDFASKTYTDVLSLLPETDVQTRDPFMTLFAASAIRCIELSPHVGMSRSVCRIWVHESGGVIFRYASREYFDQYMTSIYEADNQAWEIYRRSRQLELETDEKHRALREFIATLREEQSSER